MSLASPANETEPENSCPWGKTRIVKYVTIQKLFIPPRNAKYRSGWEYWFAVAMVAFARTTYRLLEDVTGACNKGGADDTSYSKTLSTAKPYFGEKLEIPPPRA